MGLVAFIVSSDFGCRSGSGKGSASNREISDRMKQALREKGEMSRQLALLQNQANNNVDDAVERMRDDFRRVRDFYAANASSSPDLDAELDKVDNLWQAVLSSWTLKKDNPDGHDYAGVLSGMQDVQSRLKDIGDSTLLIDNDNVEKALINLQKAQADFADLQQQLKVKTVHLQSIVAEARVKIERARESAREKASRQRDNSREAAEQARARLRASQDQSKQAQERQIDRNRQQQEALRDRMQSLRDRMNR